MNGRSTGVHETFARVAEMSATARQRLLATMRRLVRQSAPTWDSRRVAAKSDPSSFDNELPRVAHGRWFRIFIGLDLVALAFCIFFFIAAAQYLLPQLDPLKLQRFACYVIVALTFIGTAAFIAYKRPGEPVVPFAYGALMAQGLCLLATMLRESSPLPLSADLTFRAMMAFDGLNLPLAYHFYVAYLRTEMEEPRGAKALPYMYGWAMATVLFRWTIWDVEPRYFSPALVRFWFETFYLGAPALLLWLVLVNFKRLKDSASRRRVGLFLLCSIAGVLAYGASRGLRWLLVLPELSHMKSSPTAYAIEISVVLIIALIPLATAYTIVFRAMFNISISTADFAIQVYRGIQAGLMLLIVLALSINGDRTVKEVFVNNPLVVASAFAFGVLWISEPAVSRWFRRHSGHAPGFNQCSGCGRCHWLETTRCCDDAILELKRIPRVLINTYELQRCIGEGGMSLVYEARNSKRGGLYAVKILKPQLARRDENVRRALREARAFGRLNHPNIVKVYDYWNLPDYPIFLVMELIHGQPLSAFLQERPMSLREAGECFPQIFDAVAAAHSKEIIHRDLKPKNVMLTRREDGTLHITLLDFGIAKLKSGAGDTDLTRPHIVIGTELYSSPEQKRAMEVDLRTDIYSLGVMLTEALTSHLPFPGANEKEMAKSAWDNNIRYLDDAAGLPSPVLVAIRKSLATTPDDRFQTIAEFRDAVMPHLGPRGVTITAN